MDSAQLHEMQNNKNSCEFQRDRSEQNEFLTKTQNESYQAQNLACNAENEKQNIYQQEFESKSNDDVIQKEQFKNDKSNQINKQNVQQEMQRVDKNNKIEIFLHNFEGNLDDDYQRIIKNIQYQRQINNDKVSESISGSDFEKKCQIRNDLRQQTNLMAAEGQLNQKLTTQQFFNQDKSFLFNLIIPTQNAQENISKNNNNQNMRNSIINTNPYQTVNVGLSKIALKNKLNPQMLKKFQNVSEQQEDYLVKLFDESPQYEDKQVFNFQNINGETASKYSVQKEEFNQFILNDYITKSSILNEQQQQVRKNVELQVQKILENLKQSNNQKLIQLFQQIEDDDNDKDFNFKIQIRQKYLQN